MSGPIIDVAIGLVWKDGRVLIARRPAGAHLGDLWEFPGGKVEAGESPEVGLLRELREELGIEAEVAAKRAVIEFTYPGRPVRLHPFDCRWLSGEPHPAGCEDPRWVAPADLPAYEFPPANAPLLAELQGGNADPGNCSTRGAELPQSSV
jgi:8-oxo-dGTP diphosphatase